MLCKNLRCNKIYIGNTQQEMKNRMGQHFGDVVKLVNKDEKSDSFAAHAANHFFKCEKKATVGLVRAMFKTRIIWKGNIISCMKSFGKRSCKLCMKERIAILEVLENHPGRLINSRSEVFGGCRHITRFHRYLNRPLEHPSTDDGLNPERVKFGYNGSFLNWWNDFF